MDALIKIAISLVDSILAELPRLITALADAAPTIISAMIDKAPELVMGIIHSFVENLPSIISSIIAALPDLVIEFIKMGPQLILEMIKMIPDLLKVIALELPKAIIIGILEGLKGALDAITQQIKDIFKIDLTSASKTAGKAIDTVTGGIKKVTKFLGFEEGGIVPYTGLISAHKGELVVPRDDLESLRSFIKDQSNYQKPNTYQPVSAMDKTQNLTVNIKVGEKQLADILLNLNRQGFRTA